MHRHAQHKYAHAVKPAAPVRHSNLEPDIKPTFPNIERTHHVDNHPKRADPGLMCTNTQCTNYAAAVKSNLAANYAAIDPCVDFSTYACGGWREKHDFRADQACKISRTLPFFMRKD